ISTDGLWTLLEQARKAVKENDPNKIMYINALVFTIRAYELPIWIRVQKDIEKIPTFSIETVAALNALIHHSQYANVWQLVERDLVKKYPQSYPSMTRIKDFNQDRLDF